MARSVKFSLTAASAVVLLAVGACGGGGSDAPAAPPPTNGGGGTPPPTADTTPPVILAVDALVPGGTTKVSLMKSGAAVPLTSVFTITVDERTQCPTNQPVHGTFGTLKGSYTCVPGTPSVWTVVPDEPLVSGRGYTLTVSPRDLAGNQSTLTTSFTAVAPAPPVGTVYPAAVVAFGPNWVHRVDPTAPQGVAPIVNKTGREFYSYGFRATPLPDCRIQVSALDNYTFEPLWVLWDRKNNEFTLDTSGTAPPRLVGNYTFSVMPDPNYPGTLISVVVGDERYFTLNTGDSRTAWYQKGAAPAVALWTFELSVKAIIAYPACTVQ